MKHSYSSKVVIRSIYHTLQPTGRVLNQCVSRVSRREQLLLDRKFYFIEFSLPRAVKDHLILRQFVQIVDAAQQVVH